MTTYFQLLYTLQCHKSPTIDLGIVGDVVHAGRVVKRPKQEDGRRLHEATIQLLEQQQNLCGLLREVGNPDVCNVLSTGEQKQADGVSPAFSGSLLVCELRHQASRTGVPVAALAVKMVLERLTEITGSEEEEEEDEDDNERRRLLTSSQRVQLCVLLESGKELLSQGALCPKLLWQEYRRDQRLPKLEVVYHLHVYSVLTLKHILENDDGVRSWLASQLKTLCSWTPPPGEDQTRQVQQKVLSTVVGVLVGTGFELSREPAGPDRRTSQLCCSVLDDVLFWLLDAVEKNLMLQTDGRGAEQWIRIFDASLCGVSASADALQRFFTHSLTHTLTYKPRLTVSDAITLQNEWTFAKASRLVTSLFRKLAVMFSVEQLLRHLQQVLETHEVNWKHVLCFLSTLLVYNPCAEPSLRELLSRLLSSAFEGYDLENLITAFLLARQGALEGPGIFPSYSDWFKMSFGGGSSCHAASKKSLVFLLKFLSDLVPFEPPQYLKVHILHPPYVPMKHRSLLMEYVSLAKTRLADLKCQAVQDVEKAVSLFESTGRISATVMEASIFRRPYFLTRFLPTLLKPRVLPVKADARMSFIEALKTADKIPAAQYSSYVESCQKQRQQDCGYSFEMSAQLSRISHTLSVVFSGRPDKLIERSIIKLHASAPPSSSELHVKAANEVLRNFCQCVLDASRANPLNKQSLWASRFVSMLLGNTQLLSSLLHRLWDLFHNQGPSLSAAHILGLAVFVVHLHVSTSHGPLVQLDPALLPEPVPVGDALSLALVCSTHANMLFCVRFCVAAVCYGMCRADSLPQLQQQDYIVTSFYKKLLYLIPRLLPEARRAPVTAAGPVSEDEEENLPGLWSSATDANNSWRKTARHLWRHPAFSQLGQTPRYQWLTEELRVRRSEDALSDPERQEYQQWACLELYLSCPEDQGGCGGDMNSLCCHLLNAVIDQSSRSGADVRDFLFELVSDRCSAAAASLSVSAELHTQHTVNTWNRVLLALPAVMFIKVKTEGGRTTLDVNRLIEHVNQHQRKACSPAGLLSFRLTAHLLRAVLCAGVRCGRPADEVNRSWSQISLHCPLLLVSTAHWWERLYPLLLSLWRRLCDGESVPKQLQLLADCQSWACSLEKGPSPTSVPAASPLLLAASLHHACRYNQDFSTALNTLRPERVNQHRQVLVFLLFLCVNDYLSALLYPQETIHQRSRTLCADLLPALVDSADWLLIFKSNEQQGVYQPITMVTTDEFTRLMPWAFYSLLLQQSAELRRKTVCCPGFLHTAVLCYASLLQLFLDGHELPTTSNPSDNQILNDAKKFLLSAIAETSPAALSSSQLTQLESQCADLDPEVSAALLVHLNPPSLSPEMDFL
ncbi:Fanconi anemia group A protein [Collichthys lucidus]|uniref:Fanconi anemia group A protein n=1 Tax=Collichthys lucidus TaxID=240159 RepID=A0A4U5UF40_COLLU|nr:Fanconi anemia group A protein [Collichthys lucidus]